MDTDQDVVSSRATPLVIRRDRLALARVESAAAAFLDALGVACDAAGLRDTPRRMARAYIELLTPDEVELTTFDNDEDYSDLLVVRGIRFHSLCEHHVLPFVGSADIAYLPGKRIVGLSKLARVVQAFARRLQVQERMTAQIADWLAERLETDGVGVQVRAEHLCMSLRGVNASGAITTTQVLRGRLKVDPLLREDWTRLTAHAQQH